MPLVLLVALLAGAATDALLDRLVAAHGGPWPVPVAVALGVLPLLLLPDAAATVAPTLDPVHYPADWSVVRRLAAGGGDAVVVPFAAYRTFAWAPGRPVLDPAPRLLAVPVVVDDRLSVSGRLLGGEDRHADGGGAGARRTGRQPAGRRPAGGGGALGRGRERHPGRSARTSAASPWCTPAARCRCSGCLDRSPDGKWPAARLAVVLGGDGLAAAVALAAALGLARRSGAVERLRAARRRRPGRPGSRVELPRRRPERC